MCESNAKSPKSQSRHKDMYKTSPNWQQLYRVQCLSRLQHNRHETRSRLIEKFRNFNINETSSDEHFLNDSELMIESVMKSVWDQYNKAIIPHINESEVNEFMEQIRQELIIEESQYWENLLESRKKEEIEWLLTNCDSVVCFFCKRSPIKLISFNDKTQLICNNCGFEFTAQCSITLGSLQKRIDDIISEHNSICINRDFDFNIIEKTFINSSNNISLSCSVCGKSQLIF